MTEDLTLNMNAYLPLRDVVFNTLREAILKESLSRGASYGAAAGSKAWGEPHADP